LTKYDRPVPAIYNTVVQELIVQQHFMRHNLRYKYDKVCSYASVEPCALLVIATTRPWFSCKCPCTPTICINCAASPYVLRVMW
jgi:hypothetical protein